MELDSTNYCGEYAICKVLSWAPVVVTRVKESPIISMMCMSGLQTNQDIERYPYGAIGEERQQRAMGVGEYE